eukprot:14355558-Ditylum_brightwellii.AAC.1
MTAEEFLQKWDSGESKKKLKNKLLLYSSNVADTQHYWHSTFWEFKKTIPGDWVKPGGMPKIGYRSGMKGMMDNKDVVKKKELKKFKLSREYDLYEQSTNMTNHCRMHKCSAY